MNKWQDYSLVYATLINTAEIITDIKMKGTGRLSVVYEHIFFDTIYWLVPSEDLERPAFHNRESTRHFLTYILLPFEKERMYVLLKESIKEIYDRQGLKEP